MAPLREVSVHSVKSPLSKPSAKRGLSGSPCPVLVVEVVLVSVVVPLVVVVGVVVVTWIVVALVAVVGGSCTVVNW